MNDIRYLDLHGDRVAYRVAGDELPGPETLLLLHGMASSSATWDELLPLLGRHYRVIAPDLPGHGESDQRHDDYSLGASAVWLRDLLDALAIPKVTVVGQSLSGSIAMQFAHQHRDRCDRVALIGSGGLASDLSWMLRLLSAPGTEFVVPALATKPVMSVGLGAARAIRDRLFAAGLRSTPADELLDACSALTDTDGWQPFLQTLRSVLDHRGHSLDALNRFPLAARVPVLLLWGAQDSIIPVEQGYAAHRQLAGSRLEILQDVGHLPHVEAPDVVAGLLQDFIASTERRSVLATRC